MAKSAVFIDLDRTLLRHASGQVLNQALVEEGVLPAGRSLPGDKLLYAVNDRLGENLFSMGLVRAAARVARGWHQDQVQAAGRRAVSALSELVAPFAPQRLAAFRADGHRLVLSTTTPLDMIAPFAEAFGFDDVIATAYETKDGRYTGRLYEGFVWGTGKLRAVREWADGQGHRPRQLPRVQRQHLRRAVALERRLAPRRESRSVPHRRGRGAALARGALGPAARGPERHRARAVPPAAPVRAQALVPVRTLRHRRRRERAHAGSRSCLASNHRSYFDVAALALVAREIGRPVRFLGKKEIFEAPWSG